MSHALHLIAKNLPGYGVADKRCLPCSGVSGRAIAISPHSLHGERRINSQVKIGSLKYFHREASFVCRAASNGHRRNQDFSKQKRGFRGVNRKNEDRESFETFDESEPLFSKDGPLPSLSGSSKFQATAAPGQREKEIVELFRKVQAKLRERAASKEERKIELSQGKGKENETVDSLLKLLRKHSVEQGKRKGSRGSRGELNLGPREEDGSYNEDKSSSYFDTNGDLRNKAKETHSRSLRRPASNFRRRSPVPQVKYQSIYSSAVNSESQLNSNGKTEISSVESPPEYKYEPVLESELEEGLDPEDEEELDSEDEKELEPESIYEDTNVFDYVSAVSDATDVDDADNDVDEDKQGESEGEDLSALKVTELRALAKSRGVKGYSKMKKDDLLALLSSSHSHSN